jgi:23S rRNA (uracil1939-C5)-methyltransferase
VLGETLAISPGGFAQASPLLFDAFAACVLDAVCAELAPGTRVVELHAGAGFFTLPLARRVQEICAVESDLRAVEDLRRNLGRAGSSHVEVVREQAGVFLARQVRSARGDRPRIGCVLLDPPRTGLERGAARNLAALAPAQIVYVSCDPATLARDARELTARGYSLTSLRAFDLFPQTAHVEVVSQWRRARRESIG